MNDVYVIAHDPLVRLGVRHLIGGYERVGSCVTVERFTDLPPDLAPDAIAILVAPATSAMRQVCARQPSLVMLSSPAPALIRAAVRAGAHAVVTTATSAPQMRIALDVVAAGGLYLCDVLSQRIRAGADVTFPKRLRASTDAVGPGHAGGGPVQRSREPTRRFPLLAPREMEALELIAGGLTHAQAARALGVAETTVNGYVTRIRAKLNAANKAELARKAIAYGLVRWYAPGGADR